MACQTPFRLQRRLEVLESRGSASDSVDPRIETLESLMQGLLGNMQDQNSGSRENHATATGALQHSLQQCGSEVAEVKAQLGRLRADVSQTTAQMKEDDRRLKSALHRIEMLEQASEKLRGRCDQIRWPETTIFSLSAESFVLHSQPFDIGLHIFWISPHFRVILM